MSIKHMFLQEQLDNRLFQHCEEYQQFIFTFRSYFALQEVSNVLLVHGLLLVCHTFILSHLSRLNCSTSN